MSDDTLWGVVPAAGTGSRMGQSMPKQYLPLAGDVVITHSLRRLLAIPGMQRVMVCLSKTDDRFEQLAIVSDARLQRVAGGSERCHSVLNGLMALAGQARESDWVLVHDAARPCVRLADIQRLRTVTKDHPAGGLLAIRMADTVKRADGHHVLETVDRAPLWRAQTPQLFRYGLLREALRQALATGIQVTDEAHAMELAGHFPLLVEGHEDNLKITRPADLALAEFFLSATTQACE